MGHAVLIIEDEATLAKNIKSFLDRHGFEARTAATAEDGLVQLETFKPDIVLLDFHLPGMDGMQALAKITALDARILTIMITGNSSIQMAVDAMKAGASDYLSKPVILSELRLRIEKALGQNRMEQTLTYYQERAAQAGGLQQLIGDSAPMRSLRATIEQLLNSERQLEEGTVPAVLIVGDTGTGKELVARALHFESDRRERPLIELNCATIPTQLLESELFGYERGAFTDARGRKLGLVEAADGGTLFLDEIGDIELGLQGKLLKLLEEKSVRRLGSLRDVRVDVRIVAATNKPLEKLVQKGAFRSDLYFRLRGVQLVLPVLCERDKDILLLARHFLALNGARYQKPDLVFSPEAEQVLLDYAWPGNVRELRNVVEEAVLLASAPVIGPDQLSLCATLGRSKPGVSSATRAMLPDISSGGLQLGEVERGLILQALQKTSWNVTRAAKLLGVSRDTLRYRIDKFNLVEHRQDENGLD
jgi:DNA-binding NtrC family response regulator